MLSFSSMIMTMKGTTTTTTKNHRHRILSVRAITASCCLVALIVAICGNNKQSTLPSIMTTTTTTTTTAKQQTKSNNIPTEITTTTTTTTIGRKTNSTKTEEILSHTTSQVSRLTTTISSTTREQEQVVKENDRHHRSVSLTKNAQEESQLLQSIKMKLKPRQLEFRKDDNNDNNVITKTLAPHQFLHLHHMKTGGTSMDHLMKCARQRLEVMTNWTIPYYNIHECHRFEFRQCVQNDTYTCRQPMKDASMMSYCAPLKYLDLFTWKKEEATISAFTVLRHPVDRVWSMFRFEPRNCYKCKNLTYIYQLMDDAAASGQDFVPGYDSLCLAQLQNHQVTNLLTSDFPEINNNSNNAAATTTEDEMVQQAIQNMKQFFTVIGLTERLKETTELLGTVFPWLAIEIQGSDTICHLPHDNSSPENNHCIPPKFKGDKSQHWDLPDHPDEETRKAIEAHNQLDMKLYEAAVQYFELQMRAAADVGI